MKVLIMNYTLNVNTQTRKEAIQLFEMLLYTKPMKIKHIINVRYLRHLTREYTVQPANTFHAFLHSGCDVSVCVFPDVFIGRGGCAVMSLLNKRRGKEKKSMR